MVGVKGVVRAYVDGRKVSAESGVALKG